jgi:hypothetical protein
VAKSDEPDGPYAGWTLPAHPLVAGLSVNSPDDLQTAITVAKSVATTKTTLPFTSVEFDEEGVDRFGTGPRSVDVVIFGGYLGGRVDDQGTGYADADKTYWKVLFLTATLSDWLLVPRNQILLHDRVADDKAAYGLRDLLWVRADAQVGRGERSMSAAALFLNGGFTRAGDFAPSVSGGTLASPNSGLLCEAITPGCCTRPSRP